MLVLRRILAVLVFAILSLAAVAQNLPSAPPSSPASQQQTEDEIRKQEESQRGFGVLPMFAVTSRRNAPPLTPRQKFRLFSKSAFDPFVFAEVGIQAGISQAQNSFPDYGQGAAGFARRYGAALGDSVSSNFFSNFAWPVLLKQDPRYFRSGQGSIKRRIAYSLAQVFVAHTDKGGRSINFSNILGAASAGGVSNLYYPESDRGFTLTMTRAGIALIYGSLGGLLNEFWPDIQRRFRKRPKPQTAPTPAP